MSGPVEEVAAELGFTYDSAAIAALDSQITMAIGIIEILGRTTQAVSQHMGRMFRAAGLPVDALDRSVEQFNEDLEKSRREVLGLSRALDKSERAADDAGDSAEQMGDDTKRGADDAKRSVNDLAAAAGLLGLAFGAIHFATELGETARQVRVLSSAMGVSVESASEWNAVARTVGAGAEDIQDAMVTLSERFLDATNGGQDARDMMARLGLQVPRTAAEIPGAEEGLLQLADAFAAIENPAERAAKASELLGDNGVRLLPFLSRGRRGIEEMRKRVRDLGGGLSSEGVAEIEKFQGALIFVQTAFESLFDVMAKKFLPGVTWLVDKFADAVGWFQDVADHSHILETIFGVLAAAATYFGVSAAAAWIAATWPILLAVGAALLLAAAIDDLWVGLEGGDSLIGRVLDQLLGVGAAAEFFDQLRAGWESVVAFVTGTVAPYFTQLWEGLKPSIMGVRDVALGLFRRISAAVGPLAEMLLSMWERIREPVTNVLGFIFRAIRWLAVKAGELFGGIFTVLGAGLTTWWETVSGIIQRVVGWLDRIGVLDALGVAADAIGEAAAGTSFSTDAPTPNPGGTQSAIDSSQAAGGGSAPRTVTTNNTVEATINLPVGVTEEQARRLGREAAQGIIDAQQEAQLEGLEATA